jgi:hypothetical protein
VSSKQHLSIPYSLAAANSPIFRTASKQLFLPERAVDDTFSNVVVGNLPVGASPGCCRQREYGIN